MTTTHLKSVCPYCGVGCGIVMQGSFENQKAKRRRSRSPEGGEHGAFVVKGAIDVDRSMPGI